ncbi:hypothetical protein PR002_g14435 [Phytophthora rubi]|uniref:Uncharacterized protein n=1 Tax=Phytophthora rubi TaxID=129364 RepID=A0A6A3L206_9STRA|nr:hypothetical protein PR002_g14435 [Phytophthora rubi]
MQVPGTARQEDSYEHVGEGGSAVEDSDRQHKAEGAKALASPDDEGEVDADESKNSEVQEAGDTTTRSARDGSEGECRATVVARSKFCIFKIRKASDVDNMVSSRQSAITTTNDHDATATEVARFNAADAENVSTVTENESVTRHTVTTISFLPSW